MKTYQGSCHCGDVRFEADVDLAAGTLRCNCSICRKARFWPAIVKPAAFRLLAGEERLTTYRFNRGIDQHFFCARCGIRPFVIGDSPRWGVFYGVNLTCLDDATDEELSAAPVTYVDGRGENWHLPPAETRYL
jgi:hypothetical protein